MLVLSLCFLFKNDKVTILFSVFVQVTNASHVIIALGGIIFPPLTRKLMMMYGVRGKRITKKTNKYPRKRERKQHYIYLRESNKITEINNNYLFLTLRVFFCRYYGDHRSAGSQHYSQHVAVPSCDMARQTSERDPC